MSYTLEFSLFIEPVKIDEPKYMLDSKTIIDNFLCTNQVEIRYVC